jgi:alkanesulfonate monooxygenase SsuD/methylene tetrahydromethanopterin reductase-like flavin-dependent oxidoreductase (luciferase family)
MRMSVFSVLDHYPVFERTLPELYNQVMEQATAAEELGYDTFFVAEHHFHEYGAIPNPLIFLATLAQQTKRLRLGTAVSVLTFHNPLMLAESYAMVDVLSRGRLTLGVGSGYLTHEFAGYAVDPATKRDRFDENLLLIRRLLSGERVTYQGKYHNLDAVQLNVLPSQAEVPIYVAVLSKEAAYHMGLRGERLLFVPYASVDSFAKIGELAADYRRGRTDGGHPDGPNLIGVALHTHVGENENSIGPTAAPAFERYVNSRLYAKKQNYADIMRSGLALFGTVESVADQVVALRRMGIDHILTLHNFGLMDQTEVLRSMRLIMSRVMPAVKERSALR